MLYLRTWLYLAVLGLIIGCNSSSSSNSTKDPSLPVVEIAPPPEDVIPDDIICSGLSQLPLIDAIASNELEHYPALNVIDSNFMSESRWSSLESSQNIILTLENFGLIKGLSLTWFNNDERSYSFDVEVSKDQKDWISVLTSQQSDATSTRSQYIAIPEHSVRYIKISPRGNSFNNESHLVEVEAFGCLAEITPLIALNDWYLSIPVDESTNTKAQSIYESELNNHYFNAEFFFTNPSGGQVFRAPIAGAKTSTNTKYTRTELREMLRQGDTSIKVQGVNKNNWVFSSAPTNDQSAAAGVDGELVAELEVNHVTQTGDLSQVGRVIIGQIHANDDEPIRVYYRKLPQNNKGSIYLAHEVLGGEDIYFELLGTRSQSADNPTDGIALNERFGYQIKVTGNLLTFTITREGQLDVTETIDMSKSDYDVGGQYMYFKAGVYNQNNSGNPKDYVKATFYKIENSHTGYEQ